MTTMIICAVLIEPVAAPENVQLKVAEEKPSIIVTWSPIPKQCYNSNSLTGYHVFYTPSSKECRGGTVLVPPHTTKCTINFLDKGVAYAVSVAAGNCIGIGPYSIPSVAIVGGEIGMTPRVLQLTSHIPLVNVHRYLLWCMPLTDAHDYRMC